MMAYDHILKFLTESYWAMTPQMVEKLYNIVETRAAGIEIDIAQIEAAMGKKLENSREITIQDKVAIIPVMGTISKRMGLFTQVSGGASSEAIQVDIQSAIDNKGVDSVFLKIDSPGGVIPGIFELSDFIYQARGKKPIIAYADGMMASAAYLIGSAADEIIAYSTSEIGSIGVVTVHTDVSEADKQAGVKRTILTSGKYKALGNPYEPLNEDAQNYRQLQLDYYYSLFINAVMRNRNISEKKALAMADGKIFIGQQAFDVGLVDKLGNFDFALGRAQKRRRKMDLATLRAEHPNLVEALHNEGQEQGQKTGHAEGLKAGQKIGYDEGFKAGVETEKGREAKIREFTPPGMEQMASNLIAKGASVSEAMEAMLLQAKVEAAAKLESDKKVKTEKLDQLHLESPAAVDPLKKPDNKLNTAGLTADERAKKEWEFDPKLRAEFSGVGGEDAYVAFVVNQEKGLIKGKFQ